MSFLGGYDAEKAITSRDGIRRELEEIRKGRVHHSFRRGVVREFISSQSSLSPQIVDSLEREGADRLQVLKAPPNSIAIIPIDEGLAHFQNQIVICYPFFPFLQFPIKPGETVWFITEGGTDPAPNAPGWWLSRVTTPNQTENPNYVHHDRQYWSIEETGYPNGAGSDASFTLPGDIDAFDEIVSARGSIRSFYPRSVARPVSNVNRAGLVGSQGSGLALDAYLGTATAELYAGLPQPISRMSDRGWEEIDISRLNYETEAVGGRGERAVARIGAYERSHHATQILSVQEPTLEAFAGKRSAQTNGPLVVQESQGASVSCGREWAGVFGGSSSFTLQDGQAAIEARRTLVNSREVVLLPDDSTSLKVGGLENQQNMVLGNNLNEWLSDLTDILDDFIGAVSSAKIPSPVGPLDLGTAATDGGLLLDVGIQLKDRLERARKELPRHLSVVGSITDRNLKDQEDE